MNVLVGVISPFPVWIMPRRFVDELRRDFPQHRFLDAWDRAAIRRLLPDAEVAFTPSVDPDVLPAAVRLRWVQSPAVGVGDLLYPALVASPVVVTSARGVRAAAIAEHVLGVTIALARQLPAAMRAQARHEWIQEALEGESAGTRTLAGRRMGIVGLGSIGMEVATMALRFGFRVSAIRRRADRPLPDGLDEVLPPERLPELLAKSDVIVLAAPLTPATRRLIGPREMGHVKRGAYLVNVGRGSLVDDDAVVRALRDGGLGGAALDVFTEEPLRPDSPYWDLPNVLVTPHVCGSMHDYWPRLVALFAENLRRFERGDPLVNLVDKVAGY